MNRELLIILVVVILSLSGCDGGSSYDKGYEAGYDGMGKGLLYKIGSQYKAGYDDGADDVYYFNLGYQDARNGKGPRYPDMEEYMGGYREGS